MIGWLHALVVRTSASRRLYALAVLLGPALLFIVLMPLAQRFAAATAGLLPFDLQNQLTVAAVLEQLPSYTNASRRWYYLFTAADYVFPVFASLFLGATGAFFLRRGFPAVFVRLDRWRAFALFFLPALCDWAENFVSLLVILGYPADLEGGARLLVLAKQAKLTTLTVFQGLTWPVVVVSAAAWGWRARSRAPGADAPRPEL